VRSFMLFTIIGGLAHATINPAYTQESIERSAAPRSTAAPSGSGSIPNAPARASKTKKPDAEWCNRGGCWPEYITSFTKGNSGLFTIRTRTEYRCDSSFPQCESDPQPPTNSIYKVQCKTPGGYIEYVEPGRTLRAPEPDPDPPHTFRQKASQLWTVVCSGKAGR
jgi:hypothetical protein